MTAHAKINVAERDPRLWTADQFLEFLATRPDEERWQLVDGLPMMMISPTQVHQRIGLNLIRLLSDTFDDSRPDLLAYYDLGVRIPGVDDFHPQPDVVVTSSAADYSHYVLDFYLVAEVSSPSNTAEMIGRKLDLYRTHPSNLYVLMISQDEVLVSVQARDDGWFKRELRFLDDELSLPAFGFTARLADIYKGTPLAR